MWKWKARSYDFGTGVFTLDFEKTIQKYHPGVTLMWSNTLGIKIFNFYNQFVLNANPADNDVSTVFGLHFTQKLILVLILGFTLTIAFDLLLRFFERRYVYIAMLLLILEPFYLGLTRVIHLEGLMSTFMLVAALYFYSYLNDDKKKYLILTGVFTGLAVLTKTSALALVAFVGLVLFYFTIKNKGKFRTKLIKLARNYGLFLFSVIATFFILWPATWVNLKLVFETLYSGVYDVGIEEGHTQLFMGKRVDDPGFLFYPIVLAFRMSMFNF